MIQKETGRSNLQIRRLQLEEKNLFLPEEMQLKFAKGFLFILFFEKRGLQVMTLGF
jgi:hypothetical protein